MGHFNWPLTVEEFLINQASDINARSFKLVVRISHFLSPNAGDFLTIPGVPQSPRVEGCSGFQRLHKWRFLRSTTKKWSSDEGRSGRNGFDAFISQGGGDEDQSLANSLTAYSIALILLFTNAFLSKSLAFNTINEP